ncbi:MAG: 30S ribosomal protein S12 methylthiotransferase RimO [Clostridia bacterium]|nr:30S ribosomal protein S12 methylthiotransferase RimO [Clostridia bacterium]
MAIKIGMASLGCPKNQVDGEMLLARLTSAGYELTPYEEEADVIVVNTCGFIEDAKREAIDTILELAELKEQGNLKVLVVTGCLYERYREELETALPEIDAVVGIGKNGDIVSIVEQALNGKKSGYYAEKNCLPLEGERVLISPSHYAYLKIAEGCNNKCAYCAIPSIRGEMRSRKIEDVVAEAKTLVNHGVKELIVVAQDTTRYGEDLYGKPMLPQLLTQLCQIEDLRWIRILYAYPDRLTDELIEVMAREEKIVKYLDLPIQHCNGAVLKRMNRPGNRQSLTQQIGALRKAIPDIVIRTTVMVGFPGETEEQFEELCDFVKEMNFPRLGCFAFSEEEGTPAAEMDGAVPMEVRLNRQSILMEQQSLSLLELTEQKVGTLQKVLVEEFDYDRNQFVGRTTADAPEIDCKVYINAAQGTIGDFMQVRITNTEDLDLIGNMIESEGDQ